MQVVFKEEDVVEEEQKNDTYRSGEMRKEPLGLSDEREEGYQAKCWMKIWPTKIEKATLTKSSMWIR